MKKLGDSTTQEKIQKMMMEHIADCLYMCIDLEVYGITDPNVEFYYNENNGNIDTVIMRYYDSIRLYSSDIGPICNECVEFIRSFKPMAICGQSSIIKVLESYFSEYEPEYGIIISNNKYTEFKQFELITQAGIQDVKEIAELMFSTEEFSRNNTISTLEKQLLDRMKMGMGRNYIIRENGAVVAHSAIVAEYGDYAIESGLVVREDCKKKLYGMIIHQYIIKQLTLENKVLFGIRYNNGMRKNAKAEKLNILSECGRLIPR